jgi:hypothetical protein
MHGQHTSSSVAACAVTQSSTAVRPETSMSDLRRRFESGDSAMPNPAGGWTQPPSLWSWMCRPNVQIYLVHMLRISIISHVIYLGN